LVRIRPEIDSTQHVSANVQGEAERKLISPGKPRPMTAGDAPFAILSFRAIRAQAKVSDRAATA
jgi:hypothetical protein